MEYKGWTVSNGSYAGGWMYWATFTTPDGGIMAPSVLHAWTAGMAGTQPRLLISTPPWNWAIKMALRSNIRRMERQRQREIKTRID